MAFAEDPVVAAISVTVTLLLICMLIGHLLHTNRWVNDSITSLILGLCAGTVVFVTTNGHNSHILQFDENLFFYYLLPPIIFNAGFQVKKKQIFQNFAAIMLFGVTGVFISFTIITAGCKLIFPNLSLPLSFTDYMALGVIFSATDSVCTLQVLHQDETPLLYSLVFGEGVMNDASSVVLFNAIQSLNVSDVDALRILALMGKFLYLFLTSTLLGVSVGLLSAFVVKKLYVGRHSTDREISIMTLMPYLSYMLSELLDLSGILTVFFCGIVMSHYTWHNVTESSRTTTRHTFATMSFIAETFIFMYVGMDALDKDKWEMTNVGTRKESPNFLVLRIRVSKHLQQLTVRENFSLRTTMPRGLRVVQLHVKDTMVKKGRCNYSKVPGHYIVECPKRIANEMKRQGTSSGDFVAPIENVTSNTQAHFVQDDKEFVFAALEEEMLSMGD